MIWGSTPSTVPRTLGDIDFDLKDVRLFKGGSSMFGLDLWSWIVSRAWCFCSASSERTIIPLNLGI